MTTYRVYQASSDDDAAAIEAKLNELAQDGYRLVHAQGHLFVMEKQPVHITGIRSAEWIYPTDPALKPPLIVTGDATAAPLEVFDTPMSAPPTPFRQKAPASARKARTKR